MDIGKLFRREITEEMRESYLDYAMSVIVSRALPDARDGLKPAQRRILYSMFELGLKPNAKFRKSAFIAGDVLGKYHPHGESAVYDTLVRLAQPFSLRYPLIQGQGNFGSLDGDPPAAMRYTEAKLASISEELLADIERDTVEFSPNYDATRREPRVLPAKIPNLLLNGSIGIAVGMATNIPPHNLAEVVDATLYFLSHPEATAEELCEFIKGPDFPTGGMIYDKKALLEAYSSGKGSVVVRGKAEIEEKKGGGSNIVIAEIPYEVNKAELVARIAALVEGKRINGVRDIRDESDREGMRVVVELKQDAYPERVLQQLYRFTDLERAYHFNMLALVDGIQPQVLSLRAIISEYAKHREDVVRRRTVFDLERAKERIHILEGLARALENIDAVIQTIKTADDRQDAKIKLVKKFSLTQVQADAILEMRLSNLAKLERENIIGELKIKRLAAKELDAILGDPKKVSAVVATELEEVKKKYGDPRRTEVHPEQLGEVPEETYIPQEEVIVALSASGYIKRMKPSLIRTQRRGGKGVIGFEVREDEDVLKVVVAANTHDSLLLFSNLGRVFQVRVYEIPETSRMSRGKPVQGFLGLGPNETVSAMLPFPKGRKAKHIAFGTIRGVLKKTALDEFKNISRRGLIVLKIKKDDALMWVELSSGEDDIILVSERGQSVRFPEKQIRSMARTAAGVLCMKLKHGDRLAGMGVIEGGRIPKSEKTEKFVGPRVLVMTKNGYGKQTSAAGYRVQRRGGIGIKTANITEKTGPIIGAKIVVVETELIAASVKGQTIRMDLKSIPVLSRATQGVRVMKLAEGDSLVSIACF